MNSPPARRKPVTKTPRRSPIEPLEPRTLLTANPFTPGDIVVYRVGTGPTPTAAPTAVFLDEYTPAGTLVQSIAMPTFAAADLTATETASSEGQLTLSPDGSTIALTGYDVTPNGTTQGTDNGTVALVGASANPTFYVLPSASVVNGAKIRTATVDGNKLYIAGSGSYVQYAAISSLTPGGAVNAATTELNTAVADVEQLQIFNGQLYFSTEKQSTKYGTGTDSVATLGTGEPTAAGAAAAGLADTSTSTGSFFFERLGSTTGGPDTLYVADTSAGIEKYSLVGGTWVARGTLPVSGGAYGITGTVDSSGYVHIYATNASGIYTVVDGSGQAGTLGGGVTKIVTAVLNTVIDGVVIAPDDGVGAITGLGTTAYTCGTAAINPAAAAVFTDASDFDGGTLVVSGGLAGDSLGITPGGGITTAAAAVSDDGTQIGTFSGGNGTAALTITFNGVAQNPVTAAAVQALIRQISFGSPATAATGNRSLSVQVTENNGAAGKAAVVTVSVSAPAATAPVIAGLGTINIPSGAGPQSINLTGIAHNGGSGAITITAVSDSPAVIPNTGVGGVAVDYTSGDPTGAVTFTPAAGASGPVGITVTVADSGGVSTVVETVNVIGPPVVTVPAGQAVVENNSLAFSAAAAVVSVGDFAVGTGAVQVSLSVSHGSLVLAGSGGLTFTAGGNGQAAMTVTGTLAAVNQSLNGLTYEPAAGFTGADALSITASDLGRTAIGTIQSATAAVPLTVIAPSPVLLNEIEANEPGTGDNRFEYVELAGTPGASLSNVYFVAFDGSAGATGLADLVVNLTGDTLGSDGLLLIESSSTTGHSTTGTIPAATTMVFDPAFFTETGGFPNGSMSFFLFDSPDAAFAQGANYDTNTDGVLDSLPDGAAAIDNVAVPNTNDTNDLVYGGVTVTENPSQNKGTADAVTRFPNSAATASAAWFGGELLDAGNVNSQIDYDPTRQSTNEPANAFLTPGAANFLTPPAFSAAVYSLTVAKAAASGTAVGAVSAAAVGTDTITYGLTGTGVSNFALNATTGAITVAAGAALTAGTYSLTASATDNQAHVTATVPVTVTVTRIGTSVAVTSNTSSPSYGQTVTFTATVTPVSGTGETGTVQFQIDGSNIGVPVTLTGNTAVLPTSGLDAGSHSVTAIYSGDANFAGGTSPALALPVAPVPLDLNGSSFYLKLDADGQHLDLWDSAADTGPPTEQILLTDVQSISITAGAGAGLVTVDFSAGDPLPAGGLADTGTGAGNTLRVIGSPGNDTVTASAGQFVIDGASISSTGVGQTTFTPGAGTDSLDVASGSLTLAPAAGSTGITAMTFSSISIGPGSLLAVAAPATPALRSVLVASNLTLAQSAGVWTGTLDLSANDLIVRGGSLAVITGQIRSGLDLPAGADWAGTGIISSAAAADTTHLTTLGVIQNSTDGTPTGAPIYATGSPAGGFDGVATAAADVLVKYTYFGDANLDGKVDGSDYSLIDAGYAAAATPASWASGDFNDDGVIDGTDYALIDNAFNQQKAAVPAAAVAAAAVHEPILPVQSVREQPAPAKAAAPAFVPPGEFQAVVTDDGLSDWQKQKAKRHKRSD